MIGWLGAGIEVVDGMRAGESQGWLHAGRRRSTSNVRGENTDDTRPSRYAALGKV